MKKIKILFLINSLKVGGTEKRLVAILEKLDKNIFNPYLCCLVETGPLEKRVIDAGIPIKVLGYSGVRVAGKLSPIRFLQFPKIIFKFYKFLKKEKFDILQTFLPISNTIGGIVGKAAGISHIVSSRVCMGEYRDINPFYQPIENYASDKADIIICNAKMVYEDVLKREKIDTKKLRIIYNGVDTNIFEKIDEKRTREELRKEFSVPFDSPIVGIIANLYKYKGIEYFIEAAKIINKNFPTVHFLIVGKDFGMQDKLIHQTKSLGVENIVHFTGFREDIPQLISAMDILTLTSLEEGMPNVLLEGMAGKKPIVTTNAGGCSEVIKDGETGFIVPIKNSEMLAEKIMILLKDKNLQITMGEAGYQRVKEMLSVEKMVKEYSDIYCSFYKNKE